MRYIYSVLKTLPKFQALCTSDSCTSIHPCVCYLKWCAVEADICFHPSTPISEITSLAKARIFSFFPRKRRALLYVMPEYFLCVTWIVKSIQGKPLKVNLLLVICFRCSFTFTKYGWLIAEIRMGSNCMANLVLILFQKAPKSCSSAAV